jgi:uncharacterized protein (DUF488 family)
VEVFTIGFTRTSAEHFFGRLKTAGVRRLLDVRLNNTSQLAGWAKQADLPYFLQELCAAEYHHEPLLAPTAAILDAYKKNGGDWSVYETAFLRLMAERHIETAIDRNQFAIPTALLCSEDTATHCHRRLVLDYLREKWGDFTITHL